MNETMFILCEKNSVAKDFAAALGCKQNHGYYTSNDGSILITYCVGHLLELAEPASYDTRYKVWDINDLPILPSPWKVEPKEKTKPQLEIIKSKIKTKSWDKIIIATDADREGELIASYVMDYCVIKRDANTTYRFWASEALTADVVRKSLHAVKPWTDYEALYREGLARSHADWLVGMNMSRYISSGNRETFSVGRVQTAVLAAIAARNNQVKNFVPQPFKVLTAEIQDKNDKKIYADLINPDTKKTSFFGPDNFELLIKELTGTKIDETKIDKKERKSFPPLLYNTTALQKDCSKLFGYSPAETLSIMQNLYEKHKAISYPRSPSRVMGDDNVALYLEKFQALKETYVSSKFCQIKNLSLSNKRVFDSSKLEAHHAIIPLKQLSSDASEKEKNVYRLVKESFFLAIMEPEIYEETKCIFKVKNNLFRATIRNVISPGWTEAESLMLKNSEKKEDQSVDNFDFQNCIINSLKIKECMTTPPKQFTEESILSFMENPKSEVSDGTKLVGLGTQATRAAIIETLFSMNYIVKDKKNLIATEKGFYLLDELQKNIHAGKIVSISETTDWEKMLSNNPAEFEKSIKDMVCQAVKEPKKCGKYEKKSIGKCPLCKADLKDLKYSWTCPNHMGPEKSCSFWGIPKNQFGIKITEADAIKLISLKKTGLKSLSFHKSGKSARGRLFLDPKENYSMKIDFANNPSAKK